MSRHKITHRDDEIVAKLAGSVAEIAARQTRLVEELTETRQLAQAANSRGRDAQKQHEVLRTAVQRIDANVGRIHEIAGQLSYDQKGLRGILDDLAQQLALLGRRVAQLEGNQEVIAADETPVPDPVAVDRFLPASSPATMTPSNNAGP